jgi:DNA-binding MarR family transcriptional regulator
MFIDTEILWAYPGLKLETGQTMQSIFDLLHRAGQTVTAIFIEANLPHDLTVRQYQVLAAIAAEEGISQTDLSKRTGIDRSTLADIVRRLSERGIIRRTRTKADGRAYAVSLGPQALAILSAAAPVAQRVDEKLLAAIPAKDRAAFMRSLEQIVAIS